MERPDGDLFDESHARSIGLNTTGLCCCSSPCWPPVPWRHCKPWAPSRSFAAVVTLNDRTAADRPLSTPAGDCRHIGSLTSFFGARLSYYLDGATGSIIVVAQTLLFLVTFVALPNTACWPTAVAPGRDHAADHASPNRSSFRLWSTPC